MKRNFKIAGFSFALIAITTLLFTSCPSPNNVTDLDDDNEYYNPHAGQGRGVNFSHNSGLHPVPFYLTLTARQGFTIYYSIDGSVPHPSRVDASGGNTQVVFRYTGPIRIADRNNPMQPNLLATLENSAQFYGNPYGSRDHMPPAFLPDDLCERTPKATVIRAVAVNNSNGNVSEAATRTFFIGNNLARYGNHPILSIVIDPDCFVSEERGIYVRGPAGRLWNSTPPYNFRMRGREWERKASLEFFTGTPTSRTMPLADNVGIRVRGGWSRAHGQKSFNIFFRSDYGGRDLLTNFYLIPGARRADGAPLTTYKSFILRNGGNDGDRTKFRDVYLQRLLGDRNFTTQSAIPVVVYINGEYWGFYNMQERYSDNHIEYVFGVNRNNVISVENNEIDDGTHADLLEYNALVDSFINANMANQAEFERFKTHFDIQNFLDYWAAQIYIFNQDWPHNNVRIWRTRNPEPGNPWSDGRWRYQLLDTEFSLGIYAGGSLAPNGQNAFEQIFSGDFSGHRNNRLFRSLLDNADFSRMFVNTMMDLYNVNFHLDTAIPALHEIAEVYRPLLVDFHRRWGVGWDGIVDDTVRDMTRFLTDIRGAMVYSYLPTHIHAIDVGTPVNVTLSAQAPGAYIRINTVAPRSNWTGRYFTNVPVTVTAVVPQGYVFEGWEVSGGIVTDKMAVETTVDLTGNAVIVARFSRPSAAPVNVILYPASFSLTTGDSQTLTATVEPSNTTVFWTSSNTGVATVNSSGRVTAVTGGTATITASVAVGAFATSTVTVNPAVTDVSLNIISRNMDIGNTVRLTTTVSPGNAPNRNVTWVSSDTNVATVSPDGTVIAVGPGTATITVTAVDGGLYAECEITVTTFTGLLNLANHLQSVTVPLPHRIDSDDTFNSVFPWNGPVRPGWFGDPAGMHASYEVFDDGGINKLRVMEYVKWGPGLIFYGFTRVYNWGTINGLGLQVGDRIEIRGSFAPGNTDGIVLNVGSSWNPLQEWGFLDTSGTFEHTFVLTHGDVDYISGTHYLRLKTTGTYPFSGWVEGGNETFIIEQIRVSRP